MDTIIYLFSWVCGQERVFFADGAPLPVCQRCLGLYTGTVLTSVWLSVSGIWRCGLPSMSVFLVHLVILLLAMLGGLHIIDPGPQWRFLFGLWTAHVVTAWMVGAALYLWTQLGSTTRQPRAWRTTDKFQSVLFPMLLAGLAALIPALLSLGWTFWTTIAVLGWVVLSVVILGVIVLLIKYFPRMGNQHGA